MLRGAAWCCVVLRGAAWCCVMLRGAAWCCVVLRERRKGDGCDLEYIVVPIDGRRRGDGRRGEEERRGDDD